jgi:hypothetical protein
LLSEVTDPLACTIGCVSRTWILQANPKLYDIDAALKVKPVLYWRIPQYADEVEKGDRALIWRAGKQAGLVGWGVFLSEPELYDLSSERPSFWKTSVQGQSGEKHAPLRAWPATEVPKSEFSVVLPKHRIVTAPMGTVFPLDAGDVEALTPMLQAGRYELARSVGSEFTLLPVLPGPKPEPAPPVVSSLAANITPAMFLLSSRRERPMEITIEGDALRLLLAEREAIKAPLEGWDKVGVYLLIASPHGEGTTLSAYVGKAQDLRSRIKTGHNLKEWTRCLLVKREEPHAFNASDISWLERRLIDVLLEAPQVNLINKTPPPPERVPDYKGAILERTVVAVLGVLGVLGAYTG